MLDSLSHWCDRDPCIQSVVIESTFMFQISSVFGVSDVTKEVIVKGNKLLSRWFYNYF
ncbi:hypothetical protein V6Z12_D02G194700 [Gossypium hirsutum]